MNPDDFGAMTAIFDVPLQRRRKPSGHNGLTGDCRHPYRQHGKSGRNSIYAVLKRFRSTMGELMSSRDRAEAMVFDYAMCVDETFLDGMALVSPVWPLYGGQGLCQPRGQLVTRLDEWRYAG